MTRRRFPSTLSCVSWFILLCAPCAHAAETPDLHRRAQSLYKQKPTTARLTGWAEARRAAGEKGAYADILSNSPGNAADRVSLYEAAAWRALPVGQGDSHRFKQLVTELERAGKSPWAPVFRMVVAAVDNDRPALIAAAGKLADAPAAFPSDVAERAHLDVLRELGLDDTRAALEVIAHRSFAPLHALLDLDKVLTRDADFFKGTSRAGDAKTLESARDKLRQAYLDASKHLVERLFALHLLGRKQDCDALLFAARELPYLTDPAELARTLAKLSPEDAATLIVQPLLAGEVRLIQSPPKLPAGPAAPAAAELTIASKSKTVREGISTYEGTVRVRAKALEITCDQLAAVAGPAPKDQADTKPSPKLLSGAGHVAIKGAPGFTHVQADHFTFDLDTGAFSLGGDVRLARGEQVLKYRACTLSRTGELRDTISLLDDLDALPDVPAKLALIPRVAAAYADDELPAAAKYLLAMHLLRPHLRWHELYAAPERPAREGEVAKQLIEQVKRLSDTESGDDDERWKEAHTGEPWMRADAAAQLRASRRDALRDDKVEALLSRELPTDYYWTLADPAHADVDRARRLLQSISGGEIAWPASRWAAALARNNAVVTLDVAGGYPASKPARVVLDVRAADRVTVALYRVTDPQTLLAAAGQIGNDFLYHDYGLADPAQRHRVLRQRMMRAMVAHQRMARLEEHRERPTLLLKDRVA
ncbi:MAG TPA: hypothetical protein VK986_23835, partial [Tepidisphaeraceae bacterium]|nr:hypothetical protein [Tepidisphaeraceae bacterium]